MNTQPVREVDAATARQWIDRGEAVLVDVRDPDEHAREHIRGSSLVPLSNFDTRAIPARAGKIVVHCRGGRRSGEAAARLVAEGMCEVYSLRGGIEGWKAASLPVERNARIPIGIMRQVQITVGTLVLVCSLLAIAVSPWFAALAAFFGAGLLFAGATGTCALAALLSRMPWNAALRPTDAKGSGPTDCRL